MTAPRLHIHSLLDATTVGAQEDMGPPPAFAVPGGSFGAYTVLELVYQGRRSVVVRCLHAGVPTVVKFLRRARLGPGDVARFRREYELSRRVQHANIVSAETLDSHGGVLFLAMPDDGAASVRALLRNGPLPLADALRTTIAVVDALQAIHAQGILHKDIAPGNIIAHLAKGTVKLIDFGIAADMSVERPQATNLRELEGTLAYMAPEQTGRMNHDLDYRADFYALGATLFEMLTGRPPFGNPSDPVEAVHAHLAIAPPPLLPLRPDAPPVLAALLARLLAKEPEARYQNHHVLRRDLQQILQQLQQPEALAGLVLAQGDLSERFQVSGRLYGRAEDIRHMVEVFESAARGTARTITIAGVSGIGKTALVHEVQRSLLGHRGQMVSGKFNQFGQHTPCAAFLQALEQRARQVLALPPAEQAVWREALLQRLGPNAAIAQAALPELGVLLGDTLPPVVALGPTESENRFLRSMQLCFAALASASTPLVVFIDDLQWADRVSRRLLRELALDDGLQHLLLIGAYRAGEVPPEHPLAQDLAALADTGGRCLALSVGALQPDAVAQLLADSLQQPLAEVQALAQLCVEKTGGNPFFLGRFLEDLHRRNLIWLDRSQPRWCWSEERIRSERIADNVVALMLEQLRRLPPDTGTVLTTAACLGSRFALAALGVACQRPDAAVLQALGPALEAGLLVPQDARYKWISMLDAVESQGLRVEFAFVHDRVQEAAYLLATPAQRPALHLRIGRLLRDGSARGTPDFAVVNHLNQGQALMLDAEERVQLAGFNARASRLASDAASFDLAAGYATQAIALYGDAHWRRQPEAALDLHVHAARMAALKGDSAAMDGFIEAALPHVAEPAARARLLDVRIESFYASGRLDETLELGLAVLRLLGTAPPAAATPAEAMQLVAATRDEIEALGFAALAARPAMTDPLCLQQLNVIAKMTAAAYIARPALLPLLTVLQVRLMVARGHAPAALSAYSVMGLMVAEFLRDYRFGYQLGRMSMELLERHSWRHVHAHAGFSFNAFLRHWIEGISSGLPALMQVHHDGLETGSLRHAGLGLYVHDYHAFLAGTPLAELEASLEHHAATLRRIRQPVAHDYLAALRETVRALRQPRFADPPLEHAQFSAQQLAQTYTARADQTGAMFLHAWRCMLHTLAGQPEAAVAAGDAAQQLFTAGRGMVMVPFCVFFTAMAALACSHQDGTARERCTAALERLTLWAQTCADVRPLRHLLRARMLLAGLLQQDNGPADGLAELDTAQAAAQHTGNLLLLGLVHWQRSQALAHSAPGSAAVAAERAEARTIFLRWGGRALVDSMDRIDREAEQPANPSAPLPPLAGDTLLAVPDSSLDLASLMKNVQAVTGEIALDMLLARLLHVLRESAGASRAAIVLRDHGLWVLQADSGGANGPRVLECLPLEEAGSRLPLEILRTVLSTAAPVLVHDAALDPAWRRLPYFGERAGRSVLCMPLVRQGRVVGALYLENLAVSGAFSPERILFLELLSGNVVNAIDNARLVAELRSLADTLEQRVAERTRELRESEGRTLAILQNAPLPMTVTRIADNVFVYANERAAELAGMPAAALLGRDPRSMYRTPEDRDRMMEQYRREGVLRDYEMCLVVGNGRTVWALISMVPIIYDGQPCALATVVDITERKSIETALRQVASTDSLTGMASRSHFMERAETELARARRHGRPLAMVMLDVDHFKQINDRFGHAMGDEVLRMLTRTCRLLVRQQDVMGRLGGEEFSVLMPETDSAEALALAERLRTALETMPMASVRGEAVSVTASFGISSLRPDDSLDSLLARADAGLYLSKHAGRNRVSCAD
ncbi:PAS domain S-box-containing protein/diguanylate cyclase (GGDEF) domain-containing protein [Rhodoferax sp. OV413]|uniref:diguanylate cyclase n=1 Tax=Rhodoferax sp. OV413 TaxID=1855285 RepID=UPI0008818CCE|nr:diguanylate cyclase [Rhodoferax sp. OV413]SDO23429.1 PAS domain S-box-containing protein/diguanylate cyclase (GGDEF) domain-containing protein [Rhodoferax sp. OV413]